MGRFLTWDSAANGGRDYDDSDTQDGLADMRGDVCGCNGVKRNFFLEVESGYVPG